MGSNPTSSANFSLRPCTQADPPNPYSFSLVLVRILTTKDVKDVATLSTYRGAT